MMVCVYYSLSHNKLGDEGVTMLAQGLEGCDNLYKLK